MALQCGCEEAAHNDGGLVSRLPFSYNKVQLYMYPMIYIVLYLSFGSTYQLAQTHTAHRGPVPTVINPKQMVM